MEFFKLIDRFFDKKVKNLSSVKYKQKINEETLVPRKSAEVTIGVQDLPLYIKDKLKKYIYYLDKSSSALNIYLRNEKEYRQNISDIKSLEVSLKKYTIDIKIHIMVESNIVKRMNKIEKKEFVEFLNEY